MASYRKATVMRIDSRKRVILIVVVVLCAHLGLKMSVESQSYLVTIIAGNTLYICGLVVFRE